MLFLAYVAPGSPWWYYVLFWVVAGPLSLMALFVILYALVEAIPRRLQRVSLRRHIKKQSKL